MSPPVFISYARKTSREQAEALHRALGGDEGLGFLDTSNIESEERFPPGLADALLASRVVVVFASEEYFQRRFCLWELETALGEFLSLEPGRAKDAALASIVVALPPRGSTQPELLSLPPGLQESNWPMADEIAVLEKLVRTRLAGSQRSLAERLDAAGQSSAALRTRMLEQVALPQPRNLATVRVYPRALPPSLGRSFVGRADDLWRIHYTLSVLRDEPGTKTAGAALTGALQGAGGFGKTRLALEYLHRFGPSHYRGGVFWVNADVGPDRLEEQFHGILRTLRPEVPELVEFRKHERDVAREMVEALEATAAREHVLYVVDNAPEPGPGRDEALLPLSTWCPAIGKVSLLVTSRARLDTGTERVLALPVLQLAPEAAVALLREGLGPASLDESGWRRISQWVGFLPLALELLNRTLRAGAPTPEELLSRTELRRPTGELERQMGVLRRYVPPGALRGVTETFSISYARLLPAEQGVARLIAHLAPEIIPSRLLESLGPEVMSDAIRDTLLSRHFVTPVDTTDDVRMLGSMHRLLADYLRNQSPDSLTELRQASRGLLALMTPSACRDPNAWPLMNACLPHAEIVFDQLMEKGGAPEATKKVPEISLGIVLGIFLASKGIAARASTIEERVVEHAEEVLGPEHPDTLTAMNNLASSFWQQGHSAKARALEERALGVRRRVQGDAHPDTLAAMSNLAVTLRAQGDLEKARALLQEVLEERRRVLGKEHPGTLTTMNNLAATLRTQGELAGARGLLQEVLEVRRRVLGETHLDSLAAMNNLASLLREEGDFLGARVWQHEVLEGRQRVLGEEHPDTLTAMSNLAVTLLAQGDLAGARALQERELELGRRVLGEKHPDTLTSMGNLALLLFAQGDQAGARALDEHVLAVRRQVLGEEHPDTATSMNNLASILRAQGDLVGARALQQRVLEMSRRRLGEEHPDTLTSMNNLALTLRAQGDLAGARGLQERVLEVRRRVLGAEHRNTLASMGNLAVTLGAQGNLDEARALQQQVIQVMRHTLGEEHPDTLTSMSNLASTLFEQGNMKEAQALDERVLEGRRRSLGEEHPDTLRSMQNLALTLDAQGNLEEARALEQRALEGRRRVRAQTASPKGASFKGAWTGLMRWMKGFWR